MKLRRDARTLKAKALCSLRRGLETFNSFDDEGRVTSVLLLLQHSSEMLLKAVLVQAGVEIFDRRTYRALGFDKCLNLARAKCGVTDSDAGVLRAVDNLRDAAQHWIIVVAEDLLYLHARALVTVFDETLKRCLNTDLASYLPVRVLPISTTPIRDFDLLVDREYQQIKDLLAPG